MSPAYIRIMGAADGTIIATIITAHIANVVARRAALQPMAPIPCVGSCIGSIANSAHQARAAIARRAEMMAEEMAVRFDEMWRAVVLPVTGAETYDDLRALI